MKKALSILAIALTFGALSYQIAKAGPGRGWGPGNGPAVTAANSEKWQAFKADTADLRKQLGEKRRAYFNLMKGDKVDKTAAEALWSDMFDLRAQIKAKAAADGLQLPARGFRRHGWGRRGGCGCNGPRGGGYSAAGPDDATNPGPPTDGAPL